MADPVSSRSRSVRAAMQSSERHQTGAHAADSVSSERLLPEHRPSDHAGQHGSIVEGPSVAERNDAPQIHDRSTPERGSFTSFKIENPNLAEHPVDDSGGETRRRDGPVIGESASVDAPRTLRDESNAGPDHAVEAPAMITSATSLD